MAGHHPFDGKTINWQALQWLSNIELGTVLLAAVLLVMLRKRIQLLARLSLIILVVLAIGFVYDTLSKFDTLLPAQPATDKNSYLDQFYRLSSERNVIHIVPDQAQGAMLYEILADDEHYSLESDTGYQLEKFSLALAEKKNMSLKIYESLVL